MAEFPELKLRFWMNTSGGKLNRLKTFAAAWWREVQRMIFILPLTADPMTTELSIVDKLAAVRGIERLKEESEPLYRLRVKTAFENVRDAGSKAGVERIFERLGYRVADTLERDPSEPDVIFLEIPGDTPGWFADEMVRLYGCTCRRYQIQSALSIDLPLAALVIENHIEIIAASGTYEIPEGALFDDVSECFIADNAGHIITAETAVAAPESMDGSPLVIVPDTGLSTLQQEITP